MNAIYKQKGVVILNLIKKKNSHFLWILFKSLIQITNSVYEYLMYNFDVVVVVFNEIDVKGKASDIFITVKFLMICTYQITFL